MKNVFAQDCLRQSKLKLRVFLLSTFLYLSFIQQSNAQWIRMEAIPNAPVMALAVKADRLFAALEDNRIFTTTNAGFTWNALQVSSIATTRLLSIKVIDDDLYVGTFGNGIFQSKDNGQTWKNWSNITLPVTDFQQFNGKIYATTLGQGVFVYDAATDSWLAFNKACPTTRQM
ncbi:MAG TPA: hypothetical protein DCM08_05820 [Microscillaceae bacterium]|jgi:photosystem II stability/assembly factor-like uncharacterized protein|nr:hypothetical protein [Microscillaceae bacterium]